MPVCSRFDWFKWRKNYGFCTSSKCLCFFLFIVFFLFSIRFIHVIRTNVDKIFVTSAENRTLSALQKWCSLSDGAKASDCKSNITSGREKKKIKTNNRISYWFQNGPMVFFPSYSAVLLWILMHRRKRSLIADTLNLVHFDSEMSFHSDCFMSNCTFSYWIKSIVCFVLYFFSFIFLESKVFYFILTDRNWSITVLSQ